MAKKLSLTAKRNIAKRKKYMASFTNVLVNFTPNQHIKDWIKEHPDSYPFKEGETVLSLGEIKNMPGHIAIAIRAGSIHYGFHPEDFHILTEEEA